MRIVHASATRERQTWFQSTGQVVSTTRLDLSKHDGHD